MYEDEDETAEGWCDEHYQSKPCRGCMEVMLEYWAAERTSDWEEL